VFADMEEWSSQLTLWVLLQPAVRLPGSGCNTRASKLQDPVVFLRSASAKQRVKLSLLSYCAPPLSCLEGQFRK